MNQRLALMLSAVLTAFLLVVGGGVIARVSQSDAKPIEAAPTAVPAAAPVTPAIGPDLNAQVQALIQEREAAYRDLIQQANDQLQAVYQQQAATAQRAAVAPRTTTVMNQTAAAAQPAAPAVAVTADAAASIAAGVAHNHQPMAKTPELVLFAGRVAYEVVFKHGSIYVDANTGQVLFNGTTNRGSGGQTASAPPTDDGEHDDDDHDD